jgi:hypothetical protein
MVIYPVVAGKLRCQLSAISYQLSAKADGKVPSI